MLFRTAGQKHQNQQNQQLDQCSSDALEAGLPQRGVAYSAPPSVFGSLPWQLWDQDFLPAGLSCDSLEEVT